MKSSPVTESTPTKRPILPEQRLVLYGIAAGAALAGGAAPADANLITLDLTALPVSSRTTPLSSTQGRLYFNVNAASAAAAVGFTGPSVPGADFCLVRSFNGAHDLVWIGSGGAGASNNFVQGYPAHAGYFPGKASRLTTSNSVNYRGAPAQFQSQGSLAPFNLQWPLNTTGYVGLVFDINSPTSNGYHNGWANITLNSDSTVTLNALGYESVLGAPAHVQPAASAVPDGGNSLALLAIGSAGLLAFRKRQQLAA